MLTALSSAPCLARPFLDSPQAEREKGTPGASADPRSPRAQGAGRDLRRLVPSRLLQPGEIEIRLFHSLYTQRRFFDEHGRRRDLPAPSTFYTGILCLRAGGRRGVNAGLRLTLRSVQDRAFPTGEDSRTALSAFTPSVQIAPLRDHPRLSVETGLRLPTGSDLQGAQGERPFLDWDDPTWVSRFLFDRRMGSGFLLFLQGETWLRLSRKEAHLTTPLQGILHAYPGKRWTVYGLAEIAPEWVGEAAGDFYSQVGAGAKMQLSPSFELELLGTLFPLGRNAGAGSSYGLGMRLLR